MAQMQSTVARGCGAASRICCCPGVSSRRLFQHTSKTVASCHSCSSSQRRVDDTPTAAMLRHQVIGSNVPPSQLIRFGNVKRIGVDGCWSSSSLTGATRLRRHRLTALMHSISPALRLLGEPCQMQLLGAAWQGWQRFRCSCCQQRRQSCMQSPQMHCRFPHGPSMFRACSSGPQRWRLCGASQTCRVRLLCVLHTMHAARLPAPVLSRSGAQATLHQDHNGSCRCCRAAAVEGADVGDDATAGGCAVRLHASLLLQRPQAGQPGSASGGSNACCRLCVAAEDLTMMGCLHHSALVEAFARDAGLL